MSAYLNGSEISLKYAGFGKDGVSPIVEVSEIEGGHRVNVTDENKTSSFDVMNGRDGEKGKNGVDGTSPSVNVEDIKGGHRVNITDAEKTTSFDVMDGKDGEGGGNIDEAKPLFANALKGKETGKSMFIKDISPIEQELSVKLSSDSITDFSNVKLRVFKTKGKNLFDISKIITTASLKDPSIVQLTNNNDDSLTVSTYGISSIIRYDDGTWRYVTLREIAPLLEVGKAYYMSAKTNGKKSVTLCCYDENFPETEYIRCVAHWCFDSQGLTFNGINNHPLTDELLNCGVFFYNDYHNGIEEATISDIQIEPITNEEHIGKSGYSPSKYESYQNDFAEYTPNTDGTVEGVISPHPTMYIETDTEDVYISVAYNKDSNKVVSDIYTDVDTKLKEKVDKEYVNNNFVGRLKGTATGKGCITMGDIAETEHNVNVKVSSDAIADLTSVKLTRCGKNAFDISKVKSYTRLTNNGDGTLTVSGYGEAAGTLKDIAPTIQVGKIYKLSMKTTGKNFIVIGGAYNWFTHEAGLASPEGANLPITESMLSSIVYFYNDEGNTVSTISDIQIELNDAENPQEFVATEYEPFNHDIKEYTPNADGTVEGVKSLYPTTVIYSDKEGVEITADYNRDINSIKTSNLPITYTTLSEYGITDAYTKTQVDAKITESETAMATMMDEKIAEIPTASIRKFKILLNADGWFSEVSKDGSTPDELLRYFDIAHVKYEYLGIEYTEKGTGDLSEKYSYGGHPEKAVFVQLASAYNGVVTTLEQRRAYDKIKLHTIVRGFNGLNENGDVEYFYYLGIGIMGDTKPTVDIPIEVIIV